MKMSKNGRSKGILDNEINKWPYSANISRVWLFLLQKLVLVGGFKNEKNFFEKRTEKPIKTKTNQFTCDIINSTHKLSEYFKYLGG